MTTPNRTYQQLRSHLAYLKLDAAADALAPVLDEHKTASHVEVLERLLGIEVAATAERRRAGRLRLAGFPASWRLEDFDFEAQPGLNRALIEDLATLRFVEEAANVLFIGPPGVGKTHCETGQDADDLSASGRRDEHDPKSHWPGGSALAQDLSARPGGRRRHCELT